MFKYKIWDKKEPINGVPAEEVLKNSWSLQADDVILIFKEINPYRMLYIETAHGPLYQLGDTIDMTAQRYCDELTEMIVNPTPPESVEPKPFTQEQMEVIQQVVQNVSQQEINATMARMSL